MRFGGGLRLSAAARERLRPLDPDVQRIGFFIPMTQRWVHRSEGMSPKMQLSDWSIGVPWKQIRLTDAPAISRLYLVKWEMLCLKPKEP